MLDLIDIKFTKYFGIDIKTLLSLIISPYLSLKISFIEKIFYKYLGCIAGAPNTTI